MSDKKRISCTVNGVKKEFEITADEKLLDVLRRHGYKGVKWGCREGVCGACTVIMDGRAVYSCILYAFQADGRDIWTIEGVGTYEEPHPFQQALVDEGAVQCGFCIPGTILSAKAMLDKDPEPDDETVREMMDGNLCRCTGYEKIWDALHKVIEQNAEGGDA
jgi:carbon-monoxide dehydrogenase small subunit